MNGIRTLDAGFFDPAREAGFAEAVDAGLAAFEAGFAVAALDAGLAEALEAGFAAAVLDAGLVDAGLALEAGLACVQHFVFRIAISEPLFFGKHLFGRRSFGFGVFTIRFIDCFALVQFRSLGLVLLIGGLFVGLLRPGLWGLLGCNDLLGLVFDAGRAARC